MTKTKRKILYDKGESLGAPLATELVHAISQRRQSQTSPGPAVKHKTASSCMSAVLKGGMGLCFAF